MIKYDPDKFEGDLFIDRQFTRLDHSNTRGQHPAPSDSDHSIMRTFTEQQKAEFGWLSNRLGAAPAAIARHISNISGGAHVSTNAIYRAARDDAQSEHNELIQRAEDNIKKMMPLMGGMLPKDLLRFGFPSNVRSLS